MARVASMSPLAASLPRCRHIIAEYSSYQYATADNSTRDPSELLIKRDDHCSDANHHVLHTALGRRRATDAYLCLSCRPATSSGAPRMISAYRASPNEMQKRQYPSLAQCTCIDVGAWKRLIRILRYPAYFAISLSRILRYNVGRGPCCALKRLISFAAKTAMPRLSSRALSVGGSQASVLWSQGEGVGIRSFTRQPQQNPRLAPFPC